MPRHAPTSVNKLQARLTLPSLPSFLPSILPSLPLLLLPHSSQRLCRSSVTPHNRESESSHARRHTTTLNIAMHDDSGPSSPAMSQHPGMAASQSSPSLPPISKDMNDITVDIDDISSSGLSSSDDSDDDDGGVFFGKHSEAESRFLANISRTAPPRSPSPPSKRSRRQSRLVSRLRKDSTEFHRRKTVLLAPPVEEDGEQQGEQSMQERYQREISILQISPSVLASARKSSPISPSRSLCTILDHLHVSGSRSQDAGSESGSSSTDDFSDCSVDSSDGNADSDKENVQCPDSPITRSRTTDDMQLNGTSGCTSNVTEEISNHSVCIGQQDDFEEGEHISIQPSCLVLICSFSTGTRHGWTTFGRFL